MSQLKLPPPRYIRPLEAPDLSRSEAILGRVRFFPGPSIAGLLSARRGLDGSLLQARQLAGAPRLPPNPEGRREPRRRLGFRAYGSCYKPSILLQRRRNAILRPEAWHTRWA